MIRKYHKQIDFRSLNQLCCKNWRTVTSTFAPNGKLCGREYQTLNPHRKDDTFGSFGINVETGRWGDFAAGDFGGDFTSWIAYLQQVTNSEAARLLAEVLGE